MAEPCVIETGLFKKKPCGAASVTTCLNCERTLCAAHAVAETNAGGRKTGKFLCKECHAAWKEAEKNAPPPMEKPVAPKPPAAPAHGVPAAKPPAPPAAKPAPAAAKPEPKKEEAPPAKPA